MKAKGHQSAWVALMLGLSVSALMGQNLVPNGNFETFSNCPTADNQVDHAVGWNASMYSPDFWHACATAGIAGVPNNLPGYQVPHSGLGYGGVHAYTSQGLSGEGYREFMGLQLVSPLSVGTQYYAELYVSRTTASDGMQVSMQYANNNLGIFLSTVPRNGYAAWYPLPNYSHIHAPQVITDSVGWTIVQGTFIADSAYNFLYVGNFFGDMETDDTLINPTGQFGLSYYYVDDVCLTVLGGDCGTVGMQEGDVQNQLQIGPNPFGGSVWINGWANDKLYLKVYSYLGTLVHEGAVNANSEVPLPKLQRGAYIFELSSIRQEQWRVLLVHE